MVREIEKNRSNIIQNPKYNPSKFYLLSIPRTFLDPKRGFGWILHANILIKNYMALRFTKIFLNVDMNRKYRL